MSIYLLIFFGLLTNLAFCQDKGCAYKTYKGQPLDKLNYTDNKYLTSDKTDENKQKCFSLSNSDALNNKCCYKTNSSDHLGYCVDELNNDGSNVECPEDTLIANKCGMALYYQPVSKEACTEISLVDGYCCFVKTKTKGNVCLKQDSIDEKKKDEITDDMKDYFKNKLKIESDEIVSVQCMGFYFKFYGLLLLLMTVMYL